MTNPTDCPEPWEYNPSDVRIDSWSDIPVKNIWKNRETGDILVRFSTITTVSKNNYVEVHPNPDTVKSRLRQIKDILSQSEDVAVKLDKVTVTGGRRVAKCASGQDALREAIKYMERN